MASGADIVVTANPKGTFLEGNISGTPLPGTIMQIQAGTAPDGGGRHTWEAATGSTGGMIAVLRPDHLQGKDELTAYADGDRGFLYVPIAGEEINGLVADVAGTGDDVAVGDVLDYTNGELVAGSAPAPFVALEAVTDPVADYLLHVMYTGRG